MLELVGANPRGCRRDLEDFTRLHLYVDAPITYVPSISYILSLEDCATSAPAANLFRAITNGPATNAFSYLFDSGVASNQVMEMKLLSVSAATPHLVSPSLIAGNEATRFLLEGSAAGVGDLTLTVRLGAQVLCRRAVRLDLRPIEDFYDLFVLGTELNTDGRLRLFAHSQGNIAVGQALKGYTSTNNIHRFVTTQAAVSAHAWDSSVASNAQSFSWATARLLCQIQPMLILAVRPMARLRMPSTTNCYDGGLIGIVCRVRADRVVCGQQEGAIGSCPHSANWPSPS